MSATTSHPSVKVFFCYAHHDEGLRDRLAGHLTPLEDEGLIERWHDRRIPAGSDWGDHIDERLNSADIILLLVSSYFLDSDFIKEYEVPRAMERHAADEAQVIPVILRDCDWHNSSFGKLQALPKDGRPVTDWRTHDEAFRDVARGLRAIIEAALGDTTRRRKLTATPPSCLPEVLPVHVTREVTSEVVRFLAETPKGICVVYGPSGYGKSTLASQVFENWDASKRYAFNCERPIAPTYRLEGDSILVIENLDHVYKSGSTGKDSGLTNSRLHSIMPWLKEMECSVLALARKEKSAQRFLGELRRRNDPTARTIDIGQGFSPAECLQFLAGDLSEEISEHMGLALNEYIRGCPMIWMMLRDLIPDNRLPEIYVTGPDSLDQTKVRRKIYEVWFKETKLNNALTIKASQVLCRVSLFAMDTAAIAYLLGEGEENIDAAIEPLVQSGFIRWACKGDRSWTPHALYREACKAVPDSSVDEAEMRPRYRDYLRQALDDPDNDRFDFLTKIDAWIVGMKQAFSVIARRDIPLSNGAYDFAGFFNNYRELTTDLRRIFEDGQEYGMQFDWLAEAFREQIERMSCKELIGVAQVLGLVPKRNKAIAEIMWLALSPTARVSWFSEESDSWARAESIRTFAIHWQGAGDEERRGGVERLLDRARECMENRSLDASEVTHELCAISGGLCLLGSYDEALELLRNTPITFRFPDVCLAVLLFLIDNDRSSEANKFLAEFWPNIPAGWQRILLTCYLASRGICVPQSDEDEVVFVPTYISLLSDMAHARHFYDFVLKIIKAGQWEWLDPDKIVMRVKGFRAALSA